VCAIPDEAKAETVNNVKPLKIKIMIDLTKYSCKSVLQLLKMSNEFKQALSKDDETVFEHLENKYILSDKQKEFLNNYIKCKN
jgi:hypothetical protein